MDFNKNRLRELRLSRNLTMQAVADGLGCKVPYVSALERGVKAHPQKKTIQKLADFFKVDPSYFATPETVIFQNITYLSDDIKDFVLKEENIPYLQLATQLKEAGISLDKLQNIIHVIKD